MRRLRRDAGDATLSGMNLLHRSTTFVQWVLAALFLGAVTVVGTNLVRELRVATSGAPTPVEAAPPHDLPPGAIRVPVLLFEDGTGVRVGDTAAQIAMLLGRGAEVGRETAERTPEGERLVRFYEHRGRRFVLVFMLETTERNPTVTEIYLDAGSQAASNP